MANFRSQLTGWLSDIYINPMRKAEDKEYAKQIRPLKTSGKGGGKPGDSFNQTLYI